MDEKDIPEVAKSSIKAQFDLISLNMLDTRYRELFRELSLALTKACREYNVEPEITINIKYKKRENSATERSD